MLFPKRLTAPRTTLLLACCVLVVLSGCRRRPGPVQDDPVVQPPVIEDVVELPAPPPEPEPETEPEPAPPPPPAPVRIAVLLSDDLPHYESIRDEILTLAGPANVTSHSLGGDAGHTEPALAAVGGADNILAVGLLAAQAVEDLDSAKIVFCQVFNFQENGLPTPHMRGIETMPDLGPAVSAWKNLDPGLKRIGVITGPGQARRLARASTALKEHGVELVYRVTNSDKETLLEFQRLLEEIDGYWMFPDNRVLSSSTIREIMALAKRYRIGVMANDPGFHRIGALICAANEPGEVAARAFAMFEVAREDQRFESPSVEQLSRCSVTIREDVAEQLGYSTGSIPEPLRAR